jgi:predicted negative regulator of RcsB-dependent stress response
MVHSVKRITRKDLRQPDQFITATGKLLDLVSRHRTAVWVTLAAILAVGVSGAGWSVYRNRQERRAAHEYTLALKAYQSGKLQDALIAFEKVATYGSTEYGRYALLYQANAHLGLKEYEKAVPLLERFAAQEKKDVFLQQLSLMSLANAQESSGHPREAATSYSQAYGIDGYMKEEALLGKGRVEMLAGDYKSALATYQEFLKSFPNSQRSGEAKLRSAEAQAKAGQK